MNKPLAVACAIGVVLSCVAYRLKPMPATLHGYADFSSLTPGTRLTIVSPHLDDETLGTGGLIAQARAKNIPVSVIFMTNGDDNPIGANLQFGSGYATPEQLIASGETRQQEALTALGALGVDKSHMYFLGLPDRSLNTLLQPRYASTPYTAPGTLKDASPYSLSYVPNLPYAGNAVREALAKALKATDPTLVLTTLPEDTHKDHEATATFVGQVEHPELMYFLIHYKGYPNRGSVELLPPKGLANEPWQVVPLSADEVEKKRAAVDAYVTQLRIPELGSLMRSMIRTNELLLPASR